LQTGLFCYGKLGFFTMSHPKRLESFLSHRLRSEIALAGKCTVASEELAAWGTQFDTEAVEILLAELKPSSNELLRWAETLPPSANAAYLRAVVAGELGHPSEVPAWQQFFSVQAGRDPFHLLAYARALAGSNRFDEAARQLQLALSQPVRYAFFPRAAKLVQTIAGHYSGFLREVRVAVLGSSTTTLLVPVLQALCLRDRIRAEFYQGLYGSLSQEILDPESGLAKFRPDVVFLLAKWRDLSLEAVSPDEDGVAGQVIEGQKSLWKRLSGQFGCHVAQQTFDFPAEEPYGYLAESLAGGRSRLIEAINARLWREAPSYVSLVDSASVQRQAGLDRWEDPMLWQAFKQHPATEALPALAELQQAHLRAVLGLTRKVLVTDLDNTLWKGVIGEDGLHGVQIGPGTAAGEAHQRLQEYLRDLKKRGILLAVCSKNNLEDARLPFEKHEHMTLRLDDFAAFAANWDDKAQNLRQIAEKLSLGLDSFVFLDDNPIEREWVRSQLPQVAVVELGTSPFRFVRDLDRGLHFFSLSLSREDLTRAEQYRSESRRETARASSESLEEFLSQLQLEASVAPVSSANLARVAQLTNKTNQFNLTTCRYTEAQILRLAEQPGAWTGVFQLSDRMGSYGLIGVLFCKPEDAGERWEIGTWLMSCRVLGRQMERFMFDRMLEAAMAQGVREIIGVYKPTAKNGLVSGLYETLGFHKISESSDEIRYCFQTPKEPVITATHIRNMSEPKASPAMAVVQAD
jgi:FkbH-like protein